MGEQSEKEEKVGFRYAQETEALYKNRRRLAQAMRKLASEMVASDADDAAFFDAALRIEDEVQKIKASPRRVRTVGFRQRGEEQVFDYGNMHDFSPLSGLANPLAPPMQLSVLNQEAHGLVHFSSAYEGPPGLVHGGFVAASFDEFFGLVQILVERDPSMTGTLTIKYRSPCPLHTDLRLRGWLDRREGRKLFLKATLSREDQLVAEAEAIFLKMDTERYKGFADSRNRAHGSTQ